VAETPYKLLLVSESPRRREILSNAGFLFGVDTVKISEIIEENVNLREAITRIAQNKSRAYREAHKGLKGQRILLLSADTMVVLDGRALGKPKNSTEAQVFLTHLSGKTHSVITGISVENLATGESVLASDETEVQFRELSPDEIQSYVATGEPMDKAGAYAIQGEGQKFVQNIKGSRLNVVGLPLELFETILQERRWSVERVQN
jgi:septum formation protein